MIRLSEIGSIKVLCQELLSDNRVIGVKTNFKKLKKQITTYLMFKTRMKLPKEIFKKKLL